MDPSEPLATLDPADRPAAKEETPAPEAAAWLADPDAATKPTRQSFAAWLAAQPEWTGPAKHEEEDNDTPRPDHFAEAYAQYTYYKPTQWSDKRLVSPPSQPRRCALS